MTNPTDQEGVLRKISSQKLAGGTRVVWNLLDLYCSLEAIVWLICGAILAVKGVERLFSWPF